MARKTELKLRCFSEGGVCLCPALHLSLSISVTLCLPLICLLTHSPRPLLLVNEIKNDLRSCHWTPPPHFTPLAPFCLSSLAIFSRSVSPSTRRARGMCQSGTKEQKLDRRRRKRKGKGVAELREVKERGKRGGNGGKGRNERLRGADHGSAALNMERRFVTASHMFLSSSSKTPRPKPQNPQMSNCTKMPGNGAAVPTFDSVASDALLALSWPSV